MVFELSDAGTKLVYEARYRFAEGSGTLVPTKENTPSIATEYETIAPNTFNLTFTPSVLGSQSLIFSLKDENGQELITEINFDVVEIDEKQVLLDIYNNNPGSQTLLGWDIDEPDLSKWGGVTLDANGKIIELNLNHKELEILPITIVNLTKLIGLYMRGNILTTIPNEIGNLSKLKYLNLDSNNLTTIPNEIGNLAQLTGLVISGNNLTTIPNEIGNLTQLTYLISNNNNLTTIPNEIGNLTQLTELWLFNNDLTTIPPEIGNLTQLTELFLNYNNLTTIPNEIGNLTQLTYLYLQDNNLTTIPSVICDLKNSGTNVSVDSGLCD